MEIATKFLDIILNLDEYLIVLIRDYGLWVYLLLFLIIFCETGLVITPFLPGDSLLFVTGTLAAAGQLNIFILFVLLFAAAILGDTLNYWIGNYFGERVFAKSKLFKAEYLEKTKKFYDKHGGKTIIFARFIPIIRTFAPFVAGIGRMKYPKFLTFNVAGGFLWIFIFLLGGYFFGNFHWVKENLTLVIMIIIVISFIPPVIEYLKHKHAAKSS
ncbi:DedA family protein [Candidatus Woesearchaeota archaeon]|nr:DedA family protein [Candidatus Woesearchaeota archaeon]